MHIHNVIHLVGTYSHPDAVKEPQLWTSILPSRLKGYSGNLESILVTTANYTSLQRKYGKQGRPVVPKFVTNTS